jgi:hypothetical protein
LGAGVRCVFDWIRVRAPKLDEDRQTESDFERLANAIAASELRALGLPGR